MAKASSTDLSSHDCILGIEGINQLYGARSPFFAVGRGRSPGIYSTWQETAAQVEGYEGAVYRECRSYPEAKEFQKDYVNSFSIDGIPVSVHCSSLCVASFIGQRLYDRLR